MRADGKEREEGDVGAVFCRKKGSFVRERMRTKERIKPPLPNIDRRRVSTGNRERNQENAQTRSERRRKKNEKDEEEREGEP